MKQFASKQFEGQTDTFDHLQPMSIELLLNLKGQTEPHRLAIDVTYGCHCFTEAFEQAIHGDHHRYTHDGELRAFDLTRYECSLELTKVMNGITSGLIHRSDQNYTYVARITLHSKGQTTDYSVFFSL